MGWQATPYTLLLLLASGIAALTAVYVLSRRDQLDRTRARAFVVTALAVAVWSTAYWFQLSSTTMAGKLFWNRFVWVGVTLMAVAWPVFVFAYVGRHRWTSPTAVLSLGALPLVTLLAVWSSEYRGLVATPDVLHTHSQGILLVIEPGVLFLLFLLYTYVVDVVTLGVLAFDAYTHHGVRRRQSTLLTVAGTLPLIGSLLSVGQVLPLPHLDVTPITFGVTILLIAYVLFRYQVLDVVPVARTTLIEEMTDGVVILDGDERVADLNSTARTLFGDESGGLVGRPVEAALADYPTLLAHLDGSADSADLVVEHDGTRKYYDVIVTRIGGQSEATDGLVVSLRDITDRREVEHRYRTIVEQASTIVALVDADGRLQYVTPSFERTLGYTADALAGESLFDLVHPNDREAAREAFAAMDEDDATDWADVRVGHVDGSWRVFEATSERLLDDPALEGVLWTAHDVTERRQYEQRLQVLNRVLRHDVRNKMAIVQGFVSMAREETDHEEVRSWLGKAHGAGQKLLDASQQSRYVDAGLDREAELRPQRIASCVDAAIRSATEEADVTVDLDVQDDAWADATTLLEVAVEQLVANAIEHNDTDDPHVAVSVVGVASDPADSVEIRIADNGPGIPERDRHILKRGGESQLQHANGLGLWLVHWIVSAADGELSIDENEPRGSVVTVRLRRSTTRGDRRERTQSAPSQPSSSTSSNTAE